MISFRIEGDFSKTIKYLERIRHAFNRGMFDKYGQQGVAALMAATPVESGVTANSWYYEIEMSNNAVTIKFCNSNINDGVPIAVILQYGHGTGTGGWVQGRDYINPAIRPVFDRIAKDAWEEVTRV